MKTLSLIIFFSLTSFIGAAQMISSLDVMGGFGASYRILNTESEEEFILRLLESRNEREGMKLSWSTGLNYNRRLSGKLVLRTGIRLTSFGDLDKEFTDLYWPSEHNGNGGWEPDPSLPNMLKFGDAYLMAEIPLLLRLEFLNGAFQPFLEIGAAGSFMLASKNFIITEENKETVLEPLALFNYNIIQVHGVFSIGAAYMINDKWQVFGQPVLRTSLTPLVDAPIKERLFSLVLELGVRRRI